MQGPTNIQRTSKAKNIALWSLQVLVAAAFLMAGFAKLSGQQMMVEMFEKIGIGQWFRYVTGGIETVSAILLLVPRLTALGAALLVCTMTGAVVDASDSARRLTIAAGRIGRPRHHDSLGTERLREGLARPNRFGRGSSPGRA